MSPIITHIAVCRTCGSNHLKLQRDENGNGTPLAYWFECDTCGCITAPVKMLAEVNALVEWKPLKDA